VTKYWSCETSNNSRIKLDCIW